MAVISLTVGALLSPLAVQAGTYTWTTTDANGNITAQSPTFTGGKWTSGYYALPGPYPYEIGNGSTGTGDSSGQTDSYGDLTATFTWQPATGKSSATDPPPICVVKQTCRAYWTGRGPFNSPPSCSDGRDDPETDQGSANGYESGVSTGTHYRVEMPHNGVISEGLTGAQASISPANVYSSSFGCGVEWNVSIVNGNWDGPTYFHYGDYSMGTDHGLGYPTYAKSNWLDNTTSASPTIEDVSDDNNLFITPLANNTSNATSEGSITPVWYWNGPDLGVAPPSFQIEVTADARAVDAYSVTGDGESVSDGIGNTITDLGDGKRAEDAKTFYVTVQSDVYAPGEGSGYWAIGPTVNLSAAAQALNSTSYGSLTGSVSVDALISDGAPN